MTALTPKREELCATSRWDFSDLRAVYITCPLKRSPGMSHRQGLADRSTVIIERRGVTVEYSARSTTRSRPASGDLRVGEVDARNAWKSFVMTPPVRQVRARATTAATGNAMRRMTEPKRGPIAWCASLPRARRPY